MEVADQIQINSIADDKIDWVLVQDSNGETRLMTQADVVRNSNQISDLTGYVYRLIHGSHFLYLYFIKPLKVDKLATGRLVYSAFI